MFFCLHKGASAILDTLIPTPSNPPRTHQPTTHSPHTTPTHHTHNTKQPTTHRHTPLTISSNFLSSLRPCADTLRTPAAVDMAEVPPERNERVVQKMAKSVAAIIEKYRLPECKESMCVPCWHLLPSFNNRGGQPLTIMVVHEVIVKSLLVDGFDPMRPSMGVAVIWKRQVTKDKCVRQNQETVGGCPPLPAH